MSSPRSIRPLPPWLLSALAASAACAPDPASPPSSGLPPAALAAARRSVTLITGDRLTVTASLDALGFFTPEDVEDHEDDDAFERPQRHVGDGFVWMPVLNRLGARGEVEVTTAQGAVPDRYRPGHTYFESWNRAPFGPTFSDILGRPTVARDGDELTLSPTLFSEAARPGPAGATVSELRQALYRDGELVREEIGDGLDLFGRVEVPAARATYRFEADATRSPGVAELSSRVTAAWTFTSAHTEAAQVLSLPTLRFTPWLDHDNRAPRRSPLVLPVAIERLPAAAAPAITQIAIEASFDDGATWSAVRGALVGTRFIGIVLHPATAAFVALRGTARDASGTGVEQTIIRAYKLR